MLVFLCCVSRLTIRASKLAIIFLLILVQYGTANGQSLAPSAPSGEYIYLGERMVAREGGAFVFAAISPGGPSVTLSITTPEQIGIASFAGNTGQKVSLKLTSVTIASTAVSIINPDGTVLAATSVGTAGGFIDSQSLPASGTYDILVDPAASNTGNITLTLYDCSDQTGTITPGGTAVTLAFTIPGQNARLTFSGTAGQRVSLRLTGVTLSGVDIYIDDPGGSTIASRLNIGTGGGFIDVTTLPSTGTYTIRVDPDLAYTGNITLTLYNVPPDVSGTITPGGPAVTVTLTTPGQNAALTFAGNANQRISLLVSNVTITFSRVSIARGDGLDLLAPRLVNTGGTFVEPIVLPGTETYTIKVDGDQYYTGSLRLTLYDVPPDITGTISVGGPSVHLAITGAGQNASLTFGGTAGQAVTVRMANNNMGSVTVKLLRPDGTVQKSSTSSSSSFNLGSQTLATTGTYTVVVDPSGANMGSLDVNITSP